MILTVTLNPALDVTYELDALSLGAAHRVRRVHERAGGKGVNVARALQALGRTTTASGLAGGVFRDRLHIELVEAGLRDEFVDTAVESRRTIVLAPDGQAPTLFNEPGPEITGAEWRRFLTRFDDLLRTTEVVTLSGSLPAGMPASAYEELTRRAVAVGVPVVLDASGPSLLAALGARPTVIKPNEEELAELAPGGDVLDGARRLHAEGAERVVVSLGQRGLVSVSAEGVWRATPPEPVVGNPTGAGDAAVAALAVGIADDATWEECLRQAVALSASAVTRPLAGEVDRGMAERLRPQIEVVPAR